MPNSNKARIEELNQRFNILEKRVSILENLQDREPKPQPSLLDMANALNAYEIEGEHLENEEDEYLKIHYSDFERILVACDSKISDLRLFVVPDAEERSEALIKTNGMTRSELIELGIENGVYGVENYEGFTEWNT